mmetsp:Transcript_9444/g.29364  ORF Transcript_9444/g.29364 Transcript_9444/m.29364 type:complete len:230 (-) Transcript_9444:149-838(-)
MARLPPGRAPVRRGLRLRQLAVARAPGLARADARPSSLRPRRGHPPPRADAARGVPRLRPRARQRGVLRAPGRRRVHSALPARDDRRSGPRVPRAVRRRARAQLDSRRERGPRALRALARDEAVPVPRRGAVRRRQAYSRAARLRPEPERARRAATRRRGAPRHVGARGGREPRGPGEARGGLLQPREAARRGARLPLPLPQRQRVPREDLRPRAAARRRRCVLRPQDG